MTKKCEKGEHFPNWEDSEMFEVDENEIRLECNCECWDKTFMRQYSLEGEYELKGDDYIPI